MGAFLSTQRQHQNPASPMIRSPMLSPPRPSPFYIVEDFSTTEQFTDASTTAFGRLQTLDIPLLPLDCLADFLSYSPDTLEITEAIDREYWISLLQDNVGLYVRLAGGYPEDGEASVFEALFKRHLDRLRMEPLAYGRLTISGLLSLREQCLREAGKAVYAYS